MPGNGDNHMKLTPIALGVTLAIVGITFMDYRFYVVLIPTLIAFTIDSLLHKP